MVEGMGVTVTTVVFVVERGPRETRNSLQVTRHESWSQNLRPWADLMFSIRGQRP